jgi:hypothetical protein
MRSSILLQCLFALCFAGCSQRTQESESKPPVGELRCYFFFIPDCPACKTCFGKINDLGDRYKTKGLRIFAVYSDPFPDMRALQQLLADSVLRVPLVYDTMLALARQYRVKTTPQVILLSRDGNVAYSGQLDNYFYALGKHRNLVSEKYLEQAVDALLAGQTPTLNSTEPFGCKINYGREK